MQQTKSKQTSLGEIPKDWDILTLKEIGKIITGKTPSTKNKFYWNGKIPFLTPTDITNYDIRYQYKTERTISDLWINNNLKYVLPKNTVCYVSIGSTIGKICITKEEALTNQQINAIIPNNKVNKYFLYYLVKNNQFNIKKEFGGGGAAKGIINKSTFENIKLIFPPLPEQQKIAGVLGSLDDKIEMLEKQNRTLESLGQTIFKKWFIDSKEKENWEKESIISKNLASFIKPGIEKFEKEKIYLATADVSGQEIINTNTEITFDKRPSRANMQPQENSIWFAKMKDSRKLLMFDKFNNKELRKYILSTGYAGLKTNKLNHYYLWCFILNESFDKHKNNLAEGAVQIAINNNSIRKIKLLVPDEKTLKNFNEIVEPIFGKINYNKNQIQTLSQIRDLLLPKLMSGKVRVR